MSKSIDFDLLKQLSEKLSKPDATLNALSTCDHDYRKFSAFIDSIPDNSPGSSGKLLYKLLSELSKLKIGPLDKLRMLNKVRPITLLCTQQLTRSQLTPETAKTFSLSQALLKHLCAGYRAVIVGFCNLSIKHPPIHQLTHAIHHALEIEGLILLKTLQFYLQTPNSFWQDLHTLYHIANTCHITDIPNPGHMRGNEPSATIHCEYIRSLLLSCCRPNHLSNSDLATLYSALLPWSQQVILAASHNSSLFVIDLESNLPPQFHSEIQTSTRYQLALITDRLLRHLQQLTELPNANSVKGVSTRLIQTFCKILTEQPTRQEERTDNSNSIEIIYGLAEIHLALSDQNFDTFLTELTSLAPKKTKDPFANEETVHRKELLVEDVRRGTNKAEKDPGFPVCQENLCLNKPENRKITKANTLVVAKTVDISHHGACLELNNKNLPGISPGEVVITRKEDETSWKLGIVRWKKTTNTLARIIGLEYISDDPKPRAATVFKVGGQQSPYLPVLLIASPTKPSEAQLITPIMPFKSRCKIHLIGGEKTIQGQLAKQLDSTCLISRFELK